MKRLFRKKTWMQGFGLLIFHYFILRYGFYYGRGAIQRALYMKEHGEFVSNALRAYLIFAQWKRGILVDFDFGQQQHLQDRPSAKAIEDYSTDDLMGYGDEEFTKGGVDIYSQQRGLVLPLVEAALDKSIKTVCEIGTGNGDVIAHLAQKYPGKKYVGIDFSVATASKKWNLPNLSFVAGYAADLLKTIEPPDLVFASSTFLLFTPLELENYAKIMSERGVSKVILSEPQWYGYKAAKMSKTKSAHMERSVWYHHYAAYFKDKGYSASAFEERNYKHPVSARPDIVITLLAMGR